MCHDFKLKPGRKKIVQKGERLKVLWVCNDFAQGGITRYTTDLVRILSPLPIDFHVLWIVDVHTDRSAIDAIQCPIEPFSEQRFEELLEWSDVVTTPGVTIWTPGHEMILNRSADKLFGQAHGQCEYTRQLVTLTKQFTDQWFACSPAAAACVPVGADHFVPPFPIDFDRIRRRRSSIEARRELGLPLDKKIVVSASRISHDKNLLAVCEAVKACPDDVILFCVGNGHSQETLDPQMREILGDRLIRHDWMSSPFEYLDAADCFISLSLNEGGPLTVLEAFIHGTPVVSTSVGVVPATIVDGVPAAITWFGTEAIFKAFEMMPGRLNAISKSVSEKYGPEAVRAAWSEWFSRMLAG